MADRRNEAASVSQKKPVVDLELADRVAVMNNGRIEQEGTPHDVVDRPATPFVAEFLAADPNPGFRAGRRARESAGAD